MSETLRYGGRTGLEKFAHSAGVESIVGSVEIDRLLLTGRFDFPSPSQRVGGSRALRPFH